MKRSGVAFNGGSDGSNTTGLTDTWTWDGASWTLQSAQSAGSFGKGASFDERRQRVVEFGGYSGPTAGPSARRWPAMAWDGVNQLFGGDDGTSVLGETWLWGQ